MTTESVEKMLAGDATPMPWQRGISDAVAAAGVEVVVYVPDARLRGIVGALRETGISIRALTREEECVAYAVGFGATGRKAVVMMQCSGLGNSLNALGSFSPYGIGVPLVLSMRGTLGETNPAQTAMGRATKPLLDALSIQWFPLSDPDRATQVTSGVLDLAYGTGTAAAVILEPELGGQRERN